MFALEQDLDGFCLCEPLPIPAKLNSQALPLVKEPQRSFGRCKVRRSKRGAQTPCTRLFVAAGLQLICVIDEPEFGVHDLRNSR